VLLTKNRLLLFSLWLLFLNVGTTTCGRENGYLLPIRGLVDAKLESFPNHKWADPDPNELVRLFRHIQENPMEAKLKGQRARQDVARQWSNEAIAKVVMERLDYLVATAAASEITSESKSKNKAKIGDGLHAEL
jgi:hypothetical protein